MTAAETTVAGTAAPTCPSWCRIQHGRDVEEIARAVVHQDGGTLSWTPDDGGPLVWIGLVQPWRRPRKGEREGTWAKPHLYVRANGESLTFDRPEDVKALAQLIAATGADQLSENLTAAAARIAAAFAEHPPVIDW